MNRGHRKFCQHAVSTRSGVVPCGLGIALDAEYCAGHTIESLRAQLAESQAQLEAAEAALRRVQREDDGHFKVFARHADAYFKNKEGGT